ncbi:hypothetical protein [Dactylosporangium sp. NPDC006015]|uniref:hypothetical protein n=1 Tax=Dactylosporangium sp. NPDC006015 TaxID=3154576 RepID=UPI0033A14AC7
MTTTQVLITIVVLLVIAAIGYGIWFVTRRRALQHRFGPEYDRAVAEGDSRAAAERELRERERRHAELELELRELTPEARTRYTTAWTEIQARFLDDPAGAVRDADALVTELVAERGYPTGEYEEQVAHLSVEHARTLGHYRDAHEISDLSDRGEATTEQLRQAVVHYRTLFSDLLGVDATPGATPSSAAPSGTPISGAAISGAAASDDVRAAHAVRADDVRADDVRADGVRADGVRADGVRADGVRADGVRADGVRADGARADDGRADGVRADGGRANAVHADDARADHVRAGAVRADDAADASAVRDTDVPGQRDPEDVPRDTSRRS